MKVFGLTGGIASGKSTVAAILIEHGVPIVDADKLYHDLIAPVDGGPSALAKQIETAFPGVLLGDGTINRPLLGSQVFGNPEALKTLGTITHPAVGASFMQSVQALQQSGEPIAIYDVPLLYERGMQDMLAGVAVVWVPKATQLERLMARDGLSVEAAQSRLDSQLSLDEKKDKATWVIDNSGSVAETAKQVSAWLGSIR